MWGVLPIALTGVMATLDPITTTFFRFSLAAVLLTPYLILRRRLPNRRKLLSPKQLVMLLAAGLLLTSNYALYILGLEKTTPEAAQVMIQLAPMLLLLAGLWIFKEQFSKAQWLGFATFVSGLLLFFNHHLAELFISFNDYGVGLLMIIVAAVCWTGYAVIQKFLLMEFNSEETMLVFYWIGALAFLPFTDFTPLPELSSLQWGLLAFCGLNTLIAYGSFAEALVHMEASRVSAVIALTPLLTVAIVQLIPMQGIVAESLQTISLIGALMVVCGSITTAVAKK
ncbi:MAG: DMT family transporter [Porticoccaceae bacterium]|nr:DMT family transporter [Porticoccaceae bacterium]MBT5578560.1 DMT family transporter [Porticoccaceae bacterium]MBT7374617.1 DMT family transporter [Porticoccaceae bacterium]